MSAFIELIAETTHVKRKPKGSRYKEEDNLGIVKSQDNKIEQEQQ